MINSMYSFWWDVTNDWGLELFWREPSLRFRAQQSRQPIRLRDQQNRSSLGSPYLSSDTHRVASNDHLEHVKHHHWGLRTPLFYPTWVYPLLIVVNLVLRLVWLVKLSSHLHLRTDGTIATFVFEIIEVLRRWFWVFLRVEWEVIRKARERHSTSQIAILGEGFEYEMASSFSLDSDTQSSVRWLVLASVPFALLISASGPIICEVITSLGHPCMYSGVQKDFRSRDAFC